MALRFTCIFRSTCLLKGNDCVFRKQSGKKKKGVSKPEEASFYGWQQHVSQVIFKAWDPSARNPPHLLHNSSLLHNLFYFFCKVLLISQNIHPLALSLKYLWGSSAGKKSKFAFIPCQCKQKASGTINFFFFMQRDLSVFVLVPFLFICLNIRCSCFGIPVLLYFWKRKSC